jgi:hypothetical protein
LSNNTPANDNVQEDVHILEFVVVVVKDDMWSEILGRAPLPLRIRQIRHFGFQRLSDVHDSVKWKMSEAHLDSFLPTRNVRIIVNDPTNDK